MGVVSQWMMLTIPAAALFYTLFTGLVEMLVLGLLYGVVLGAKRNDCAPCRNHKRRDVGHLSPIAPQAMDQ
jgi:hypothetical protein